MRLTGFLTIAFLALLLPRTAFADAGLPMVALFLPPAWLLLLPVIAIECWYGVARLRTPLKRSLVAQAVANAFSTLIGLPLTWMIVLLSGLFVLDPIVRLVPPLVVPLYPLLLITGSAWLLPGAEQTWWQVPLSIVLLMVPFYLVSVASETFVVRRFFPTLERKLVRKWVVRSNMISYSLLLALTITVSEWPRAQEASNDLFSPVHRALLAMLDPVLDPGRDTRGGMTPLMHATMSGNYGRMRKLIAKRVDVNATDAFGWTALLKAAARGDEEAAGILLAAGARVSFRQPEMGWTALDQAAYMGDAATIRFLIAAGANPNERDGDGWTPLMMAMLYGRRDVAEALLAAGADVNARSTSGWTALKEARYRGYQELGDRLVRAGAIDFRDGTR